MTGENERESTAVNADVTVDEPTKEEAQHGEEVVRRARPIPPPKFDADKMADTLKEGVLILKEPIINGSATYTDLAFNFTELRGMELANALAYGERRGDKFAMDLTEVQALNLFACAAEKCQPVQGGLDASDIRTRIGGADAIKAIQLATCFFKFTSLAGDLRFRKTSSKQDD